MLGWMRLGAREGEPEAGQGCFELYLQIQGMQTQWARAVSLLKPYRHDGIGKIITCFFTILHHVNVFENTILCEALVQFAIVVPSIVRWLENESFVVLLFSCFN